VRTGPSMSRRPASVRPLSSRENGLRCPASGDDPGPILVGSPAIWEGRPSRCPAARHPPAPRGAAEAPGARGHSALGATDAGRQRYDRALSTEGAVVTGATPRRRATSSPEAPGATDRVAPWRLSPGRVGKRPWRGRPSAGLFSAGVARRAPLLELPTPSRGTRVVRAERTLHGRVAAPGAGSRPGRQGRAQARTPARARSTERRPPPWIASTAVRARASRWYS